MPSFFHEESRLCNVGVEPYIFPLSSSEMAIFP